MIELRTEKPILCIGDVVPDIILPYGASQRVLAAVTRGEPITGEQKSAEFAAGGSIGNTAHGIAVLGGKCLVCRQSWQRLFWPFFEANL